MASTHADHTDLRSRAEMIKVAVAAVVLVLLVLFGIVNSDEVAVDLLVTTSEVPLILVIAISALAGAVIAALVRHRRS